MADVARPLPGALAGGVGAVMHTLSSAEDTMCNAAHDALQNHRPSPSRTPDSAHLRALVQTEVKNQIGRHHQQLEHLIHEHFDQQDAELRRLATSLNHMTVDVCARRGGIPWILLLLAGGGYYLARQPQVQEKLRTYAEKLSPDTRKHLQQAGESLHEGVDHVKKGEDPRPALRDAMQETQQAVGQVMSRVQENATGDPPAAPADTHTSAVAPSSPPSTTPTRPVDAHSGPQAPVTTDSRNHKKLM
ncbi:hypothetical protein GCM10008955_37850 [Deinococcus malanensis]|uniref:DUF3618 domain-containing protein n=1 Tax=Deinococcus malanensis TaxID=1706855 RepID=A0ABQ2F454_9DEIO|nr:hypothetical protein GCM10008955_37850 [Deinococcus malanensis]